MTVALITHPLCLNHDPGLGHPESPDRLRAVIRALERREFASLLREEAPAAPREAIERVHAPGYVERLFALNPREGERIPLDPDTVIGEGSLEAALRAAGGAMHAVDCVMAGHARAAFAAIRPPGHHAERAAAMGFCLFNNAAIAASHARHHHRLQRIAIVDFDVHHGNGTENFVKNDPDLFYASTHQWPCYPGTGALEERGRFGNVVNFPLSPGADGEDFRLAWEGVILPRLEAFAPELLIVSAGFDAHFADPLAELRVRESDFGWLTERLVEVADRHAGGRIVSLLEGGYNLEALAASAAEHVRALMRARP
jgi:acetoin utilization deacetylase AcuC-like enzyme